MTESPAIDPDDRQQCGIQVIARMSRIMRVLSAHGQPCGMSLAAIAAEVELPRSTVQRIINALVVENIVEPAGSTGFRIGPALGQMLYQTHSDIVPVLKPYAEQLSLKLQETVCLVRLQQHQLHVVDAIVGEQVLRVVPQLGMAPPPQATAPGKTLLARMDDVAVQEWVRQSGAPNAVPLKQLLREMAQIRSQGFALDYDQVLPGVAGLAVSIGTYRGAYSMAVLAPTVRMREKLDSFQRELFTLRDAMEKLLGKPSLLA
ncbi:IclR family transcriptional regulator [Comamonas kerstersii]|uniref:IclR family transcriptional regulator n=1 Tax=Comamonas kerstersii TaxID=225992 RepID=UPI00345D671C